MSSLLLLLLCSKASYLDVIWDVVAEYDGLNQLWIDKVTSRIAVASLSQGIEFFDVSDPLTSPPLFKAYTDRLFYANAVGWEGGLLCVGDGRYLNVFDAADLNNVRYLGKFDVGGKVTNVVIRNGFCYAHSDLQVKGVDASDLSNIHEIGTFDDHVYHDMMLGDNYLIVSATYYGVVFLDYSNLVLMENIDTSGLVMDAWGVCQQGNLLFITDAAKEELAVLDITTITSPKLLTQVTGVEGYELACTQDYLAATGIGSAILVDTSDPENPALHGDLFCVACGSPVFFNDYLYLMGGPDGMTVYGPGMSTDAPTAAPTVAPTPLPLVTAVPTLAPATVAPVTLVPTQPPPTVAPPTSAPPTAVPTAVPATNSPPTAAPSTPSPPTPSPSTPSPATLTPATALPGLTLSPSTIAPATALPGSTLSPSTQPPVTTVPLTLVPGSTTVTPATAAPGTTLSPATQPPATTVPLTLVPGFTQSPSTITPATAVAGSTLSPATQSPATTVPATLVPGSTTITPATAVPGSTLSPATQPPATTVPLTLVPGFTQSPSTVTPATAVPGSTLSPATQPPATTVPLTLVPGSTTVTPATAAPGTTLSPSTQPPVTTVPLTLVPGSTQSPSTITPATAVAWSTLSPATQPPATTVPLTLVPGSTQSPSTVTPATAAPGSTLSPSTQPPATTVPLTLVPGSTQSPSTITPATAVPGSTLSPATQPPATTVPLTTTLAPGSTQPPPTITPATAVPGSTQIPSTQSPPATVPVTLVPGSTQSPSTQTPVTTDPSTATLPPATQATSATPAPATNAPAATFAPRVHVARTFPPRVSVQATSQPVATETPASGPTDTTAPTPDTTAPAGTAAPGETSTPGATAAPAGSTSPEVTTAPNTPLVPAGPSQVPSLLSPSEPTNEPSEAPLVEAATPPVVGGKSAESKKNAQVAAESATAAVALLGGASPNVPGALIVMGSVRCNGMPDDNEDLDLLIHPLGFRINGVPAAGAIVGNITLSIAVTLFFMVVVRLLARCNVSSRLEGADRLSAMKRAGAIIRYPSVLMPVPMMLLPGTLQSSLDLVFYPRNGTQTIGWLGLLSMFSVIGALTWRMKLPKSEVVDRKEKSCAWRYFLGTQMWKSHEDSPLFVERNGVVWDIYRDVKLARGRFFLIELIPLLPLTIISSFRSDDHTVCAIKVGLMAALLMVYTMVFVLGRLFLAPFVTHVMVIGHVFLILGLLGHCISYGIGKNDHWGVVWGLNFFTCALVACIVRAIYDFVTLLMDLYAGCKTGGKDKVKLEDLTQDVEDPFLDPENELETWDHHDTLRHSECSDTESSSTVELAKTHSSNHCLGAKNYVPAAYTEVSVVSRCESLLGVDRTPSLQPLQPGEAFPLGSRRRSFKVGSVSPARSRSSFGRPSSRASSTYTRESRLRGSSIVDLTGDGGAFPTSPGSELYSPIRNNSFAEVTLPPPRRCNTKTLVQKSTSKNSLTYI